MDDSTNPSAMDLDDDVSSSASGTESEGSQATNPTPTREYLLHKAKHTTTGRVVEAIKCPPNRPLAHEKLFDAETGKPNAVKLKKWFRKEGRLHKDDILHIVSEASAILRKEPNLLSVSSPITVCGDIHGQYYDLLKLLDIGGDPSSTTYLFLGDYVDRGYFSFECVLLLYTYKILYPTSFFLIRGNHECRHLTDYFTFKEEVEHKYDIEIYDAIMDSFDCLPLSAVLNQQFLCVHGGLSPEIRTLADIQEINRFQEPPPSGPMCDLLWADPIENYDEDHDDTFVPNQMRGCSYCYTFNAVNEFLNANKLLSVIRAHEAQDAGFRMHKKTQKGFPSVITIFSAPNYLDAYNNKGAILRYENDVLNIRQFSHSPHPYWLPSFMDVFTWSMPFVAEKLAEILLVFLNIVDDKEEEEIEQKEAKREALRAKIQTVSRLMHMYSAVRNERTQAMQLGPLLPNGIQSPEPVFSDVVVRHGSDPSKLLSSFAQAKVTDKPNERRPPFKALQSSSDSIGAKAYSLPGNLLLARFRSGQPTSSPSSSL
jgi:serine/threonine-protein phosphatase 2B catalytic subunit